MRLDNFVSKALAVSRSQAKQVIKSSRISLNNSTQCAANTQVDPHNDQIRLDDQSLALPELRYLMLNKPAGYVCARQDSDHPTVIDLLGELNKQQLQIVGRLDKDTTGLLLLSDDGQWNHRITSPNTACNKCYQVTLERPIANDAIEQFATGLLLHGEKKATRPAQLTVQDPFHVTVSIQEGKYHQVKRMFAAINNHVVSLHRASIGPLLLDSNLSPGQYRPLTKMEIQYFAN